MSMNPREALRACPFCGGNTFLHHGHNGIGFVTCGQRDDGSDGCGAVTSFRPNKGGRDAIAAWNLRAAQPPAVSVDWRELWRFQTAMRYMDNNPKLTRERAFLMALDDIERIEADAALNPEAHDGRE